MLRTLCVRPLIKKTRYVVKDGKRKWEVDKFAGENKGLVIAELETDDDDSLKSKSRIGWVMRRLAIALLQSQSGQAPVFGMAKE